MGIGDGRDHRGPGFRRTVLVRAIVAARVETQVSGFVRSRNAAFAKIRFHESTGNRLRHGEEPSCGLTGACRRGFCITRGRSWFWIGMRQAEKPPRLCRIPVLSA